MMIEKDGAAMKFKTTRFGEIEFPGEVVMTFPDGVLGFPAANRYILLEHDAEGSPFKWLQSIDDPALAFIVIDPLTINPRYLFEIDVDTARIIGQSKPDQCAVMSIVNVPHDNPLRMSANLKAPLVVNVETRVGRQIILGSQAYSINTPIFAEVSEVEETYYQQQMAI
jgi:flagellar assembly factor FliW